jgi:imidazoleglycerol phosphate synthase glutamine amidotransferase subunit HisH
MNKHLASIVKRLVAAVLVIGAVVGVSALSIHAPTQNQNALALNSIQTNKATLFYAKAVPNMGWFVEQVLASTGESKAATENLKSVAAAL